MRRPSWPTKGEGGGVVGDQKQKNQNGGNSCGKDGKLVGIIYTMQFLAGVWRLSGSAKSGETKPAVIEVEQR